MRIIERTPRMTLVYALSAGALMIYADSSFAADSPNNPLVNYEIKGTESFSWDSNPLMLATGEKSLYGSITSPELVINKTTPLSDFSSDTIVNGNVYNQSAFDSVDFHEKLNLDRHVERWSAGIQGKVDYDTARTSELTTYGLNLPKVRHTGLSIGPDLSFSPSSSDKINITTNIARSTYDNSAFVDYAVYSVSPSYEHKFDPRNTGVLTLNAQRYQTLEGDKIKVDSIGPTAGWITEITPRFTVRVDAGAQKASQATTATTAGYSEWNYIFDTDVSFKGEQDTTHLVASRSQYPFGNGTETLLTSFILTEAHAINKSLDLTGNAGYQFAKQPPEATGNNLDKQYLGGAGLSYHVFEHWDVNSTYQYRNETLTGISGSITDHTVLLGVTYHPFTTIQ